MNATLTEPAAPPIGPSIDTTSPPVRAPIGPERYERQRSVLPRDAMQRLHAHVIGCGAIGRQVALMLANTGVGTLHLHDFDRVEAHNLAAQGFAEAELGDPKVLAVEATARGLNREVRLALHPFAVGPETFVDRFEGGAIDQLHQIALDPLAVVFACVDTMEGRRHLAENLGRLGGRRLLIDTRMSGEYGKIVTCRPGEPDSLRRYLDTLVSDAEAHQGACTSRTLIYAATFIAAAAVGLFARHVRRMGVPFLSDLHLADFGMCTEED